MHKKNALLCFSPPVMLATFIFEVGAALYVLWRYKMNHLTRLAATLLFALGIFQLAEYMVCGGFGLAAHQWARIGYGAITILPPLGLHIMYEIAGKSSPKTLIFAYVSAALFAAYFVAAPNVFEGQQCLGNYVIFSLGVIPSVLYIFYYYGWLIWGVRTSLSLAARAANKRVHRALYFFTLGYAAFIIPTATVNLLQPETLKGVPSIMCGFAVILAAIIVFGILPLVDKPKHKRNN